MMSMMTFRSDDVFSARFGREVVEPVEGFTLWQRFEVERYLEYQGDKLVRRFDANSYLLLTKAMDLHDLGRGRGGMEAAFARLRAPLLSVGVSQRHPLPAPPVPRDRRRWPVTPGSPPRYAELDSPHGHDAFLIEVDQVAAVVARVHRPPGAGEERRPTPEPPDDVGHIETRAVTGGPGLEPATRWRRCCSRRPPTRSTSVDDHRRMAGTPRTAHYYSRFGSPTVQEFEQAVATLEGAEAALASASGMAALTGVIFGLCSTGDHIVAQRQLFSVTSLLLSAHCPPVRDRRDLRRRDRRRRSSPRPIRPGRTQLVLVETPANPALSLTDIEAVAAMPGPFTVVDSTFATPVLQQPLGLGADLVLHAATKGLAGHNDALLGVVAGQPRPDRRPLGLARRSRAGRRRRSTPGTGCGASARSGSGCASSAQPPRPWPSTWRTTRRSRR